MCTGSHLTNANAVRRLPGDAAIVAEATVANELFVKHLGAASRSPTVRPALPPRARTRWQLELACGWMAAGVEAATEGRTAAVRTKTEGMVSKPFMTWSQVGGPRMRFGTAATVATDNPCLHLGTVETPVHPRHPFTPCCLVAISVQVAELQEAGWEIGAHTVNHRKIADQHAEEGSLAL